MLLLLLMLFWFCRCCCGCCCYCCCFCCRCWSCCCCCCCCCGASRVHVKLLVQMGAASSRSGGIWIIWGSKRGDQQTRPSSSRWPPAHSLYTMLCLGKDTYRRRPVRYRPLMLRCPFLWLLLLQLPDPVCHWISGEEEEKPSRNKPIECRNTAKWYFW